MITNALEANGSPFHSTRSGIGTFLRQSWVGSATSCIVRQLDTRGVIVYNKTMRWRRHEVYLLLAVLIGLPMTALGVFPKAVVGLLAIGFLVLRGADIKRDRLEPQLKTRFPHDDPNAKTLHVEPVVSDWD